MAFNSGLDMAQSYYAATSSPRLDLPALTGTVEADLVVIGGGCTGLSAAFHAARHGLSVVLIEGGRIGWGASGRNGGQIIPGLRKTAIQLVETYGLERGKALFALAIEARRLVVNLIQTHGIDCDLKTTGHILGAVKPRHAVAMAAEADFLHRVMGYEHAAYLPAAEARRLVDTPYHGALLDRLGGHLHPLNYTLGLAKAARAAGAVLHERSAAVGLEQTPRRVLVKTEKGVVSARHAILAGDALLMGLQRRVNERIMPIANYIVATEPLPEASRLIPSDAAVSDSRFVLNYYRLTADGRLLFGGGERYTAAAPKDIAAFVRPYMEAVFPQLEGTRIDHAWGGLVSVTRTRMPHIGREGEVLFAHGYSGLGAVLSTLGGKLLADALHGDDAGLELFASAEPPAFPGGTRLRRPLHVLGMLWYALRDRL